MTSKAVYPATVHQCIDAQGLGQELAQLAEGNEFREELMRGFRATWSEAFRDRDKMDTFIKHEADLKARWVAESGPVATPPTLEGMHVHEDFIYKVQLAKNGSGRPYAKRLVPSDDGWHFEYAPGFIRRLSEATRMTLEDAQQFGALYGTCCVCGRTLTDEQSIAAGIGPVCASKF